ncbi:MAG: hypothetical protein RKP20_17385 [Candidatus Competibacter sp.]|nr:hypothetical protein [Candidatus Competibacter sp.]
MTQFAIFRHELQKNQHFLPIPPIRMVPRRLIAPMAKRAVANRDGQAMEKGQPSDEGWPALDWLRPSAALEVFLYSRAPAKLLKKPSPQPLSH